MFQYSSKMHFTLSTQTRWKHFLRAVTGMTDSLSSNNTLAVVTDVLLTRVAPLLGHVSSPLRNISFPFLLGLRTPHINRSVGLRHHRDRWVSTFITGWRHLGEIRSGAACVVKVKTKVTATCCTQWGRRMSPITHDAGLWLAKCGGLAKSSALIGSRLSLFHVWQRVLVWQNRCPKSVYFGP